eukprot:TRINITY_DN1869_c0_g1_i9.p1 TRINITY_DN1869_c0_g1~~TRINITY_DN1869_c0_g1_i9.p1  ORF type:complete len:311 (-),score=31.30 TRINITY_DN1869_c0_g1_i9:320-1135(-)
MSYRWMFKSSRLGRSIPILTAGVLQKTTNNSCRCQASTDEFKTFTEPKSGVEFPATLHSWNSDLETFRVLGAGCRVKKVLMLSAKVYAVAAYVEGAKATNEFGIRSRGGFFDDAVASEYCDAIMDGSFSKMLVIQLVRDVDGATFVEALDEALEPRMSLTGEMSTLEDFKQVFVGRNLTANTTVALLWVPGKSRLEVAITPQPPKDWSKVTPEKTFESAGLCRSLYEVWLGDNCVIQEARESYAQGVQKLIEADKVARGEWKPGGRYTDIQ